MLRISLHDDGNALRMGSKPSVRGGRHGDLPREFDALASLEVSKPSLFSWLAAAVLLVGCADEPPASPRGGFVSTDGDYYGVIESRPSGVAGTWIVGGRSFEAIASSRLDADDGALVVGACVSVDFEGDRALEIESEPASDCAGESPAPGSASGGPPGDSEGTSVGSGFSGEDGDWYGVVEMRPDGVAGTWTIGGRSFEVSASTRLSAEDGAVVVGACVSVDFEDNLVLEIESEPASDCSTQQAG